MNNPDGRFVLALETGIGGGSAAILENGRQIDFAEGADGLSKSEDILPVIEELLKKNGIKKKEIGLIAVSEGPGSLTGLRIGLAIAKGLGDSLAAKVYKISALEALTYCANFEGRVISAILSKKSGTFFSEFLIKDGKRTLSGDIVHRSNPVDFVKNLENLCGEDISFVVTGNLLPLIAEAAKAFENAKTLDEKRFFSVEGNLAGIIGLAAANRLRV